MATMPAVNNEDKNPKNNESSARDDWDAYWAHGFLTSCANAFSGNYEGRIREIWEECFELLPDQARVLDLATGNGAVALLASAYSLLHDKRFEIHAIDQARIDPASAWHGDPQVLKGVNFRGRIAAEKTPFETGYFQAVTGQYALEYTDYPATIKELSRIMAPGAAARFVLHHPDSVVIATSREERGHGQLLFDDSQLFEKARVLLQRIISAGGTEAREALAENHEAQAERAALNEAAAQVTEAIERSSEPELLSTALGHIGRAFRSINSTTGESVLANLDRGEHEIRANLARLDDLMAAVVDTGKMTDIRELLEAAAIKPCEPIELYFNNKNNKLLMGWQLDARRAG